MSEKSTLVVTAVPKPDEMASVQEYLQKVLPLLMGAGGTLVKRHDALQVGLHRRHLVGIRYRRHHQGRFVLLAHRPPSSLVFGTIV